MTENIQIQSTTDAPEVVKAAMSAETKPEPTKETETPAPEAARSEEKPKTEAAKEAGTESEEGETEEPSETPAEERPKKKGGFQKRIDKLNAQKAALEEEKEHWRQEALRVQKPPEQKPSEAKADGRPDPNKFEKHEDYVEALTDWKVEQKLLADKQKTREAALKEEFQKKFSAHKERIEKFVESHDDFDDVIDSVNHIPISAPVQDLILNSDNGPELMYELAKNPKDYAKICKLSPAAAGREIGKIEARFQKPTDEKPTEPKVSKAPAPIKPVTTNASTASTKSIYDEDLSQADYEKLRNQQLKRK